MSLPLDPRNRIFQSSDTATTGGPITLTGAAPAGRFNYRDLYANGNTGVPLELWDGTTGIFEFSIGTFELGASLLLDRITSRVIDVSSLGAGVPIAWGGGTRNAACMMAAESFVSRWNNGADFKDPSATFAALGGKSAGKLLDYQLGFVPVGAGVDGAWTGGSNGKVVRFSIANTLVNAANTDTPDQLSLIALRAPDGSGYYIGSNLITGLSGLTFGARYYLGTAGNYITPAPALTPGGSITLVYVGYASSTTSLVFDPKLLIRP